MRPKLILSLCQGKRQFRIDKRYSALETFRHWKPYIGMRQAYWLTLALYGWDNGPRVSGALMLAHENRRLLKLPS